MNKKLIGLLVPALAGVAIVGSGFSAWHFGESLTAEKTMNGEGSVTGVVAAGTLALNANKIEIKLDQKEAVSDKKYGQGSKGIEVTKLANVAENGTETAVTGTTPSFTFTVDPVLAQDDIAGNMQYTGYEATVALTGGISQYVNVSINGFGTNNQIGLNAGTVTSTLSFSWATNAEGESMKPATMAEYNTMLNELSGTTISAAEAKNGLSSFSFGITVTVTPLGSVIAA